MRILFINFEKDVMHLRSCDFQNKVLLLSSKQKISLSSPSRGQKYQQILNELQLLKKNDTFEAFAYHAPQKYRGAIKDEEAYANAALLHLFCEEEKIELIELSAPLVRERLNISNKDFKHLLEHEKQHCIDVLSIAKSDKCLDGVVLLRALKGLNHTP